MRTLTAIWFKASGMLAWLVLVISAFATVSFPVVIPVYQRMAHQPVNTAAIAGTCALWLAVAVGAFAVARRRAAGIPLIMLPAVSLFFSGHYLLGAAVAAGAALAFATPFLLVFTQARSSSHARQAA